MQTASDEAGELAAELCAALGVDHVADLERLSGGASRHTWRFAAALPADPPAGPSVDPPADPSVDPPADGLTALPGAPESTFPCCFNFPKKSMSCTVVAPSAPSPAHPQ